MPRSWRTCRLDCRISRKPCLGHLIGAPGETAGKEAINGRCCCGPVSAKGRSSHSFLRCAGYPDRRVKRAKMKTDSNSDHSPSDDEKKVGVKPGAFENLGTHELPPDPDEGLNDAEKAKIVSFAAQLSDSSLWFPRTESSCSSLTFVLSPGSVFST